MNAKRKLPENQSSLSFADPSNVLQHIEAFGQDHNFMPRREPKPTHLDPGPDRVEVLAQRILDGEELWHRDDKQMELRKDGIAQLLDQFHEN